MRLAVLISLCVLIVAFSIGSYVTYANWRKDRYDPLIIEAAYQHGLPPALLKAIMDARGQFKYYTMGENREVGLLQIPPEGVQEYRVAEKGPDYEFGYVCINQARKPHRGIKYTDPGVCNICKSRLIPELWYPKLNIEIASWFLKRLKKDIEKKLQGNEHDLVPLLIAAYCLTEKRVRDATHDYRDQLPPILRNSIQDVLHKYYRYRRKALK